MDHNAGLMSTISPHRKIPYHHHHIMRHKPQSMPTPEPALLKQDVVDDLLLRSITAICDEVALKQGIEGPHVEKFVMEAMLAAVDECKIDWHKYRDTSD